MSDTTFDPTAELDARLARDGLTLDAEDREYLLALVPLVREWSQHIRLPETRYGEPAMIHALKSAKSE